MGLQQFWLVGSGSLAPDYPALEIEMPDAWLERPGSPSTFPLGDEAGAYYVVVIPAYCHFSYNILLHLLFTLFVLVVTLFSVAVERTRLLPTRGLSRSQHPCSTHLK